MFDPECIKEWAPLDDLLSKIPVKSGILKTFDHNLTCLAVLPGFIALGTDSGTVLWYNREKKELQKLRTESSGSVISCLKVVDSVEYMVACGDETGRVTIFQIEKEHPSDVKFLLPMKPKPIERYTVTGVHKHPIKSLAWSKNGMKLFSGDKTGVICLTEIDYQSHTSRSKEIINEFHEIVQLSVKETYLLCSTTFRTIICHKLQDDTWNVYQVGKKDRKTLCKLGAAFLGAKQNLSVITTRPGYRFWLSDTNGNVTQTLIFKEELTGKQYNTIPLLNPSKYPITWTPLNFGLVYAYGDDRIITCGDNVVYIINLKTLKIERIVDQLRGVIDISINFPEIFILETPRSVIRLSTTPEMFGVANTNRIIPNFPLWRNEGEDCVDSAEECLDLPPIIPFIPEGAPKALEKTHEIVCKKLEQFRQIDTSSDDPILFESRGGRKKSKDRSRKSSTKSAPSANFVQNMNESKVESRENVKSEIDHILTEADSFKTISTYMDVSLYNNL